MVQTCITSLSAQGLAHLWGDRKNLQQPKVITQDFKIKCEGRCENRP